MTAWLSAAEELDAYEGIRDGDADAFRAIAEPLQPTLRRLARLYVDSSAGADALVLRTWESALRGLHMFHWHTPLATWIAKGTVTFGRTQNTTAPPSAPPPPIPAPAQEVAGPPDWSDLPWAARWQHAPATLTHTIAALPTDLREVLHGRDLEQWPPQRVRDVFGLPRTTYQQRLRCAHTRLHDALAPLIRQTGPSPHHAAQIAAITGWLNQRLHTRPEPIDPHTLAIFQHWVATRQRAWTRLIRSPPSSW